MSAAIKAEIRKMFTTRMWWGMGIAVFACGALIALLIGAFSTEGATTDPSGAPVPTESATDIAVNTYTSGAGIGYVLLMVIGIMTIGAEYRHKTITSSLLAVPKRTELIGAKIIALLAFGVIYGLIFMIGSVAVGATVLSIRGFEIFPEPGTILRSLALLFLVLGLWALIGLGLGVLIPNQVAAILVGVGIAFIVEPIVVGIIAAQDWGPNVAKFFPSRATQAVLTSNPGEGVLSWWGGSITLIVYAAIMVAIGAFLTNRRDIS